MRVAVANTTGVSSTTVASRLSTAVISDASANTAPSSRRGRWCDQRAIQVPHAWKRPSSSQSFASTSTAARNPMTGPSRSASSRTASVVIAPVAITTPAAGTANAASGQRKGRTTAHTSTTASAATDSDSSSSTVLIIHAVRCPADTASPGCRGAVPSTSRR
ncbi:hypothetical protein SALBM217S_04175 [Streptomyces griseoloalbus]